EQVDDDHQAEDGMGHEAVEAPAARAAGVGLGAVARRRGARSAADEEAARIGGIGAHGLPRLGRSDKGMAGGVFRTCGGEPPPWAGGGPAVSIGAPLTTSWGPRGCTAPPPPELTPARCVSS